MKLLLLLFPLLLSRPVLAEYMTPELDQSPYRGPQSTSAAAVVNVKEVEAEAPKKKKKGPNGEDIDDDVTNPRLRATSGSKSRWSMTFRLNYQGGTIVRPFGLYRPDIYGNPENETFTSFGGSISGRYRLDKRNSFTLGFGFSYLAPFRDDGNDDRSQFNVINPAVGYDRIERIGFLQVSSGISYTLGTSQTFRENNISGLLSLGLTLLTDFGGTRWNLGVGFGFTPRFFTDDPVPDDPRVSYSLGIYPFIEFEITRMWFLRSVLGFMNYAHFRSDENQKLTTMHTMEHYISVGVGIAVTRDVYLYPNIQFLPKDLDAEKTNIAISATINVL